MNYLKQKADANKKVAEWCERKCYYDAAVNRLYYFLFQNIKYYIITNNLENEYEQFASSEKAKSEYSTHKITYKFMCTKCEQQLTDFNDIKDLHSLRILINQRNCSDYENDVSIVGSVNYENQFKSKYRLVENVLKKINIL
ncbi:MAG: hypothetical protein PHW83_13265 [Bacteroidales bacterium]|nr:hypothetical protein [Bacteroidales bacterium]